MMKKIVLSFLLASGIAGIFHACTGCCGDYIPFWNITDFNSSIRGVTPGQDTIRADTLVIDLSFDTELLSNLNRPALIHTTYALSCPEDGDDGMKDPLTAINIRSDAPYNAFQPGVNIGSLVRVNGRDNISTTLSRAPLWPHFPGGLGLELQLVAKPQNVKTHQFVLELGFQSGRVIQDTLQRVTWL